MMNMKKRNNKIFDKYKFITILSLALCVMPIFGTGCKTPPSREVVVYTSVDQVYSEKLFDKYEKETGVKVKAVYDIEAQKTVGLVNRLISEKDKPQADVFWNGEILQTIHLKQNNILEPVSPKNSKNLPDTFRDPDKKWYGFGGRARVLIYNKTLISKDDCPKTMVEFGSAKISSKTGLAYPIFGTTSTHAAALYSLWGRDKAKIYYQTLQKNGISIVDGNGAVKDLVSSKKLSIGLTDTDDALSEMEKNKDLAILFFDQGDNEMGNLVIPNTVAKIKNGPNSKEADLLIDYLLKSSTEQFLVDEGWIQIPVNDTVKANPVIESLNIKIMNVNFNEAYMELETSKNDLTKIFIR